MRHRKKFRLGWIPVAAVALLAAPVFACWVQTIRMPGQNAWLPLAATAAWCAGMLLSIQCLYLPLSRIYKAVANADDSLHTDPVGRELTQLIQTIEGQHDKEYRLEMLKKEAELHALQSQINPHFLYNTLDSIRGRLLGEGLRQESQIVESLSNLFRYSISPKAVYNTLEQELENVENYMRITRYRFGNRFALVHEIDESTPSIYHCELPKLTLQPIVENAILHGMEKRASGGCITIRAELSVAGLHICVEDNGVGIRPETLDRLAQMFQNGASIQQSSGGGIALVNVNERIRMRYGEDYGLTVYSAEGLGTQVHILLPAQLMPEAEQQPRTAPE